MKPIYLDYNATAPLLPQALAAMQEVLQAPHNPSSVHGFGRTAKKVLEDARAIIAEAVSAFPNEVIFTSTGTEANNLALRAANGRRIIISAIEHSSILKVAPDAARIPVDADGVVKLEALEKLLTADSAPALVSVMLANNETGVMQPVAEIAALAKKYGALVHTDAAQALGKIPVDMGALGADMMTVSAHKMGGPHGAAALIVKQSLPVQPLIQGGGQELGRRAGSENIAAIAGFAAAVKTVDFAQMQKLRARLDDMEAQLIKAGGVVWGKDAARLPNTSSISMPRVLAETQLMAFDLEGFAVSAGSACSSGKVEPSHVIAAMVGEDAARDTIRVSGGWNTTEAELQAFGKAWLNLYARLSPKSAANS